MIRNRETRIRGKRSLYVTFALSDGRCKRSGLGLKYPKLYVTSLSIGTICILHTLAGREVL